MLGPQEARLEEAASHWERSLCRCCALGVTIPHPGHGFLWLYLFNFMIFWGRFLPLSRCLSPDLAARRGVSFVFLPDDGGKGRTGAVTLC
ncbi:hypothetical protein FKM82_007863 [Ascaphus truei]